ILSPLGRISAADAGAHRLRAPGPTQRNGDRISAHTILANRLGQIVTTVPFQSADDVIATNTGRHRLGTSLALGARTTVRTKLRLTRVVGHERHKNRGGTRVTPDLGTRQPVRF